MLDKALNQRDAADEALKREKELVALLSANRDALVKQAVEDEKRIRELEASVKCLTAENTELEKQVNECSELEDEKEELEEQVQDLETEKEELEEQLEKLEAKVEKLEAKVEKLKEKEEKEAIGAEMDARFTEDLREQLKASRGATEEALRVAEKNGNLYYAEVERSHAHEKRIEELEQRCYDIGNKLMEMEIERKEMLEALADKDKRIVKAVSRVVELEKGAGKAEEVERLTNLVKALCAENQRLHDQFGS